MSEIFYLNLVEMLIKAFNNSNDNNSYFYFSILSKHIKIKVPYHVHTVHHHHVKKYPVYKKIEVPVYKEVKGERTKLSKK